MPVREVLGRRARKDPRALPLAEVVDHHPLGAVVDHPHRESGIVNDPNGWFSKPEDLIAAIRRIVHVSVETVRIVAGLPEPFASRHAGEGSSATAC